jgi:hypothetical protein
LRADDEGLPIELGAMEWGHEKMTSSKRAHAKFSVSSVRQFIALVRASASFHYRRSIIASSG